MGDQDKEREHTMPDPAWVGTFTTPGIRRLNKMVLPLASDTQLMLSFSHKDAWQNAPLQIWHRDNNYSEWHYIASMNKDTEVIPTETSNNPPEVILLTYTLQQFLHVNIRTEKPVKMTVYDLAKPTITWELFLPTYDC